MLPYFFVVSKLSLLSRTDIDALRNLAASNPYFNQFQAQPVLIDTLLRVSCASPKLKGQTVTSDARFAFAVVIEVLISILPNYC